MRITAQQMVTKEVIVRTVCDGCGQTFEGDPPTSWEHFMSGHSEWGNDSSESVDWHGACSLQCFVEVAKDVIRRHGTPPTLEINYMNVEFIKELILLVDGKPKDAHVIRRP